MALLVLGYVVFLLFSFFYKLKVKRKTNRLPNSLIKIFFMTTTINFLWPVSIKKLEANGVSINDELRTIIKKANVYLYIALSIFTVCFLLMITLIYFFPNTLATW
jgi:hypothetical protein